MSAESTVALDAALAAGALVLTATRRLARDLRLAYDARQRAAGRTTWPTAAIHAWDDWKATQWVATGAELLLDAGQEQWLWEDIIAADMGDRPLLDVAATAQLAASAWRLTCDWQLPRSGKEWEQSEETQAFSRWSDELTSRCREAGWITLAQAPAPRPDGDAALAGFDELTPRQSASVLAWERAGCTVTRLAKTDPPAALTVVAAVNPEVEIQAAAAWARTLLEAGEAGPIGVVWPDLSSERSSIERVFTDVLHPSREPWSTSPPAFHLSLGEPLAAAPVAAATLALLDLAAAGPASLLPMERASALLRLPFCAGADSERESRAALDARLRRKQISMLSLVELRTQAHDAAPRLVQCLDAVLHTAAAWPRRQTWGGWEEAFHAGLDAWGWPGERPLSSAEQQTADAWRDLLASLARLEQVTVAPVSSAAALQRLQHMAEGRTFQPRAQTTAPIQIMNWTEAAGQRFYHLWLGGLNEGALPAPAAPHPLLPLAWQREHGMPRATPEGQRESAVQVFERLRRSAGAVVASYTTVNGEIAERPSPLLASFPVQAFAPVTSSAAPAALEMFPDTVAPEVPANARHGASQLFSEQSACPFRAFARLRLGAESLPEPPAGLSAKTRGSLMHAAMYGVWRELGDDGRLRAMSQEQRRELAARHAAAAVRNETLLARRPGLAAAERTRLTEEIAAWLAIEVDKRKAGFATRPELLETEREGSLAGIALRLRLDRIDELPDGRRVLIDYKTGDTSKNDWKGERPAAPQLPLYLVTDPAPASVAEIAFAQIKPGKMQWKAHSSDALEAWRTALARLADEYLRGEAAVRPSRKTCEHCDLPSLCRIGGGGIEEDDAAEHSGDGA